MRGFTVIEAGETLSIAKGFMPAEELAELGWLLEKVSNTPCWCYVDVDVRYMYFLDNPTDPVEEVTEEEVLLLGDNLEEMLAKGYVIVAGEVTLNIQGVQQEEYEEEGEGYIEGNRYEEGYKDGENYEEEGSYDVDYDEEEE